MPHVRRHKSGGGGGDSGVSACLVILIIVAVVGGLIMKNLVDDMNARKAFLPVTCTLIEYDNFTQPPFALWSYTDLTGTAQQFTDYEHLPPHPQLGFNRTAWLDPANKTVPPRFDNPANNINSDVIGIVVIVVLISLACTGLCLTIARTGRRAHSSYESDGDNSSLGRDRQASSDSKENSQQALT